MKTCFKCHTQKPLDEFYVHPMMSDGHLNKCKACAKKDSKDRYRSPEGRARAVAYSKTYYARRAHVVRAVQAKLRLRYPERAAARTAVNHAIRDGKLIRQACEVCGERRTQAHHEDYFKPLVVRWLCFKHHREVGHGQIVTAEYYQTL